MKAEMHEIKFFSVLIIDSLFLFRVLGQMKLH